MNAELTCWTLIRDAAAGDASAREQFARLYEPVARAYLAVRWGGGRPKCNIDDATQDVFVEMFRPGGALDKVDDDRPGGFRAFLFGVVRNIALRHEAKCGGPKELPSDMPNDDMSLAAAFDKAWARSLLKEASRVQSATAQQLGERAIRRVELLRMRFQAGLPIRTIAAQWNEDPAKVHHEYATARKEFREALVQVVAFHSPGACGTEINQACTELLGLLS